MRNYKGNKRKAGDLEFKTFDNGLPASEKVSADSEMYNVKAFRDLQNIKSIEVKADPNSAIIRGSNPYPIINRTNKVVDAKYSGKSNIEGNVITRLQNSTSSQLINTFDIVNMIVRLNYLYMNYIPTENGHNNLAVNAEMLKTFNEAISKAYSTMTTQLAYYVDKIETDMPIPGTFTNAEKDLYGKLGGLLHYQTVLQNCAAPISKYIQTMSLQQTALDMSYRREAPLITSVFGFLNKSAFKATLNSMGATLLGEYFDVNWYKQMNTLAYTASRKSNSIVDPLLTCVATTVVPKCTMTVVGTGDNEDEIYYDSDEVLSIKGVWLNPDTFQLDGTTDNQVSLKLEDLIYRVCRLLDVSTILTWARQYNSGILTNTTITSASAYYQQINRYVEAINAILTKFSTSMSEVRTFIDKLSSSGMVYWKTGVSLSVSNIGQFEPTYNVILDNMISCYVGGSAEMEYDQNTQRWQASTLWNKYSGIPEFDRVSGGSFLTFGLRDLKLGSLTPTDIAMCVPIMFAKELNTGSSKCITTNRKGLRFPIISTVLPTLLSNNTLARLDPLSIGFKVKVPTVDLQNYTNSSEKPKLVSACEQLLSNLMGYGQVKVNQNTTVVSCDPDYICFLDLQLEDVSNEMIAFCRNYSPFRVNTPDGRRTIGFGN